MRVAANNTKFPMPLLNAGPSYIVPTGFAQKKVSNPYSSGAGKNFGGYSETGLYISAMQRYY